MIKKSYSESWENLRARESLFRALSFVLEWEYIGVSLIGTFLFSALYFFTNAIGIKSLGLQIVVAIIVGVALFAALGWPRYSFRCPRCGNLFFIESWSLSLKTGDGKKCVHCYLERGSQEQSSIESQAQ